MFAALACGGHQQIIGKARSWVNPTAIKTRDMKPEDLQYGRCLHHSHHYSQKDFIIMLEHSQIFRFTPIVSNTMTQPCFRIHHTIYLNDSALLLN